VILMPSRKASGKTSAKDTVRGVRHVDASHTEVDPDSPLAQLKAAWEAFVNGEHERWQVAKALYPTLAATPGDAAFGWAALICGREACYRTSIGEAEGYLTAAAGSFVYSGDPYGRALAEAHLALTAAHRLELDNALKFALAPWSSSMTFSDSDARVLHSIAAYVYWSRDDNHSAILHNVQALVIADRLGNIKLRMVLLTNLSAALADFPHKALASSVANEALRLADTMTLEPVYQFIYLSNALVCNVAAGNTRAAEDIAAILERKLNLESASAWSSYLALCRFYIAKRDAPRARALWELQRQSTERSDNQMSSVKLMLTESEVSALEGNYDHAIKVAQKVLETPLKIASRTAYREAATCLSQCFAALGRSAESARWKKFAAEHAHADALSTVFTSQIEATIKRDIPNPLTAQELECLSLSARGQTSADIGLKLGIKPRTVNFHMGKILRKLDAMNRQEAIAKAITANYLRM
jgi:DNA-binding CsgD family transcriptional regulator